MATVVLATIGSWGDLFPAIGLAKGLIEAGHDARIAASPAYYELVQGEGLELSGIGPALGFSNYARDPKILSGRLGGFAGFARVFRRFIFPALDRYVDDLAASIRDADLLLAHPALVAGPIAAEYVGIRWATFSVFPGLIPTAYWPPAPTRASLGSGRTGRMVHRAAWSAARFNMARLFDGPVNRARCRVGLAAVSDAFFAPVESGCPYLVMASPLVIDRPPDWPPTVTLTGFVAWDRVSSFPDPAGPAGVSGRRRAARAGDGGGKLLARPSAFLPPRRRGGDSSRPPRPRPDRSDADPGRPSGRSGDLRHGLCPAVAGRPTLPGRGAPRRSRDDDRAPGLRTPSASGPARLRSTADGIPDDPARRCPRPPLAPCQPRPP
ncbi:MAG: glycosyltransferase, partial [Solirubrobacterales bacterium]|nr:glycosyltransferase [Solirubrobacterales bacterium]